MQRLQSLDMPASLVDEFVEAVKHAGESAQSPSEDGHSPGESHANGSSMTNGSVDSSRLPNGVSKNTAVPEKNETGTLGSRTRKKGRRDDGYFAENPQGEDEWWSSTHITLDASAVDNGQFSVLTLEEAVSNSETAYFRGANTANAEQPPIRRTGSTNEKSTAKNWVPQSHRISSPPALQSTNAAPSSAPQPGKLVHRHTLEVPQAPQSPNSRDTQRPNTDDPSANNWLSPVPTNSNRRASMSLYRRVNRSAAQSDINLDEVPPNEDAEKWAEMIRQKRATKRRRDKDEDDDRVLMGTKVDQNHVNYVTAYNMLTGIRFTVSRTNAKIDRELTDADFVAAHKFSFDITGNELTPSARYDFKFKDYAPWVFRHLRSIFRLDPADYLMSLTSKYILSELGSPGKSGSFFYFSRDYKYIIKTIHHSEHKVLRKILKTYYQHVKDNPNTLLSQFYGLHRVKIPYGRKIHFVVMNNLFPPHRDIHTTFDLKGSTTGRNFKEEDLQENPRATLKDLNWLRRDMHLELGPTKKHMFIQQMQKDVELLRKLKIMDYSLLVGIHDLARGNEDKLRDKTLQVFQPGADKGEDTSLVPVPTNNLPLMRTPSKLENQRKAKELRETLIKEKPIPMGLAGSRMPEEMAAGEKKDFYFYNDDGGFRATHEDNSPGEQIYYLGIIDCLTHYGLIKRLEHFFKSLGHTEIQISAVPPDRYGDRFLHFISGVTMSKELVERSESITGRQRPSTTTTNRLPEMSEKSPRSRPTSGIYAGPSGSSQSKTERVMDKAEHQAKKTGNKETEAGVPERVLGTVTSGSGRKSSDSAGSNGPPSGNGDTGNQTLPVVEEAGEGTGSTGGNSGRSSAGAEEQAEEAVLSSNMNRVSEASKTGVYISPDTNGDPVSFGEANSPIHHHPISNLHMSTGHHGSPLASNRPPPTPPSESLHVEADIVTHQRTYSPSQNGESDNTQNRNSIPKEPPTPPRYDHEHEPENSPVYEEDAVVTNTNHKTVNEKEVFGGNTARKLKGKFRRVDKKESVVQKKKALQV